MEIGTRIGALQTRTGDVVTLFGYGTYQGEQAFDVLHGRETAKLVLDDGSVVYGCECWWGAEEEIKAELADCTVEIVPVPNSIEAAERQHKVKQYLIRRVDELYEYLGGMLSRRGCNDFPLPDEPGRAEFEKMFESYRQRVNPGDQPEDHKVRSHMIMDFELLGLLQEANKTDKYTQVE